MNKRSSSLLAGLAAAATLALGGCGSAAVDSADVGAASLVVADVSEVNYADLNIEQADLSFELASAEEISLEDGGSQAGSGVSIDGDTITVDTAGTYRMSGTLTSGSLVVDAPDGVVNLVLDGVDITAKDVAAINVVEADRVVVWLADGTDNILADATGSAVDESEQDAPNATLFSTADLWIAGDGALRVTAHAADAITSKDTLVITSGEVTVQAADDGVRGKDQLVITGGTLTADVGGDAMRSDNESVADDPDAAVGVIWIAGGALDLTAGSDALDATGQVTVLGGKMIIAAGDDGIHSDNVLRIDGGEIAITSSVEGIEGAYMYLSGGDVSVVSSDDGINVAGGAEASAETATEGTDRLEPGMGGRPEGGPPGGQGGQPMMLEGNPNGASGTDSAGDLASLTASAMDGSGFGGPAEGDNGNRFLEFSGGTYVIDTNSDGVDVNGSMTMSGGTLVVSGTEDARNGALDVDDTFTLSGGTLAANGTATMAVAPGTDSTQATLAMTFGATVPAGTVITITDETGAQIASFTTPKASNSYIFSSSRLAAGSDYTIAVGSQVTGDAIGWLVLDPAASEGDTIGSIVAR